MRERRSEEEPVEGPVSSEKLNSNFDASFQSDPASADPRAINQPLIRGKYLTAAYKCAASYITVCLVRSRGAGPITVGGLAH